MSRFIAAGKSDLKELEAKELDASKKYQQDEEDREAPTLFEQMRLNHMEKERLHQEKVKARNQPYKIDEREHKFYESLRQKETLKEHERKRELEEGIDSFEQSKKTRVQKESKPTQKITETITIPKINVIKKKLTHRKGTHNPQLQTPTTTSPPPPLEGEAQSQQETKTTIPLVSGYSSSSESDSES